MFGSLFYCRNVWNPSLSNVEYNNRAIIPTCLHQILKDSTFSPFLLSLSLWSFSAFWWNENPISGHRSLSPTKQYKKTFRCLDVHYIVEVRECVIIERWLEQSCNHTNVSRPNFKGIYSSVLCSLVFNYVHLRYFGELKKRFLHIIYFAQPINIDKYWCFVTYNRYVNCVMRHFQIFNRTIVQK